MGKIMLKQENKIFKNLYNQFGWEIDNAMKRDDWRDTKNIISKGREWIINEVKTSELRGRGEETLQLILFIQMLTAIYSILIMVRMTLKKVL